jgi:hypothetical protein
MMLVAVAGLLLQGATVKGAINGKGVSMPVVDAVAVWDPAKSELRIPLVPYKLQQRHLKDIQKGSTMFAVLGEKSPDAKKWPKWCPGAELKLTLDAKALAKGPEALQSYHFWIYGLEKENFTDNYNQQADGAKRDVPKLTVKLDAKGMGTFSVTFAGKSAFDDATKLGRDRVGERPRCDRDK